MSLKDRKITNNNGYKGEGKVHLSVLFCKSMIIINISEKAQFQKERKNTLFFSNAIN